MLLGIDIGGTKVALASADDEGRILSRLRHPTALTGRPEDDVAGIAEEARRLVEQGAGEGGPLSAVGISVPGPIDAARGVVLHPPNLPSWEEVPIGAWLGEALGCAVKVENDANAAALAEWRFGAGRGASDMILLTMSTGIGGGIILGGRLHTGRNGTAGELGHVPVEWNGALCACGLRGCLEAYAGGAGWTAHLREQAPADGRVAVLAGGREAVTPEHLVAAAREGDAWALGEMERWNGFVACAITNLTMMLAPEVIVLGTIAVAAGEDLCLRPVRELVASHTWPHQAPYMKILPAELGEDLPYRAGVGVAMEALRAEAGAGG